MILWPLFEIRGGHRGGVVHHQKGECSLKTCVVPGYEHKPFGLEALGSHGAQDMVRKGGLSSR